MGLIRKVDSERSVASMSPAKIKEHGKATNELRRTWIVGVCLMLLTLGGLAKALLDPTLTAKDLWLILGPTISSTMAFLLGRDAKKPEQ
jgi:hypothetical protein